MYKRLITLLIMAMCSNLVIAQHTVIAKFIITDVQINKVDATKSFTDDGAYIAFYTVDGKPQEFMTNYHERSNTQSFGAMYDLSSEENQATDTSYKTQSYTFRWSYTNTYDGKSGTATVHMLMIFKPLGVAFKITMLPENLDLIVIKGFEDGTLQDIR
jgi:hypothetical protein